MMRFTVGLVLVLTDPPCRIAPSVRTSYASLTSAAAAPAYSPAMSGCTAECRSLTQRPLSTLTSAQLQHLIGTLVTLLNHRGLTRHSLSTSTLTSHGYPCYFLSSALFLCAPPLSSRL